MSDEKTAEKVICRMVESGVYEENARLKKEITRLLDQVKYEQQRNENNVALADAEIKRLREAIERESEKHKAWNKECDCECCQRCCDLCEIAREEP